MFFTDLKTNSDYFTIQHEIIDFITRMERLYCTVRNKSSYTVMVKVKVKGKAMPLQDWGDPEGFRTYRLPDFKTIGT